MSCATGGLNESLPEGDAELPFYTSGARDPHTAAFAMPVFGVHDKLVAALALTGPISRLTEDRREKEIGPLMKAAASRLSQKMGASKPFCQQFFGETSDAAEENL